MSNFNDDLELILNNLGMNGKFITDKLRVYDKYKNLADLVEQGRLVELPCAIYDSVYIIEKCENISKRLDGTLYDFDGSFGTATGYYCPYESNCPHNTDKCELVKNKNAVFKDMVIEIHLYDNGVYCMFENCNGKDLQDFGKTVFLTRKEAEKALEEVKNNE